MANKRVLSIELGVQTTRICEMDFKSKKPTIYSCCTFDTPEGAVEDGYIRNREILSVAMKDAISKSGMKATSVVFSVTSSKIANREVNLPAVNELKLKSLIMVNAREYFPVDIDEYVITHKVLEKIDVDKKQKNLRVMVLAAPTSLVESYYDFVKMLGYEILAIDYVGNSCYQVHKRQTGTGINVVVQLNEQNTLISILDSEVLALQRTVPYGMNAMVEAAVNCGAFDIVDRQSAIDKLFNENIIGTKLNESVIDDVALAYMENNDDSYAHQLKQMKAKDEITETFNYLISNIIRVLDYFAAKNPDKKARSLHLSGVGSKIKGIDTLFENEIVMDIDKFETLIGIDFERTCMIADNLKSDYTVAVGAAIDPVDFIPKEHLLAAKKKERSKTLNLASFGFMGLAAVFAVMGVVKYMGATMELNSKEEQLDSMSAIRVVANEYGQVVRDKNDANAFYVSTLNYNYLLGLLIEELEVSLPKGVKVNSLSCDGNAITINISANSIDRVGETLIQLKQCALIDSVSMNSLSGSANNEGLTSFTFTANCTAYQFNYNDFLGQKINETFIRSLTDPEAVKNEETTDDKAQSGQTASGNAKKAE